MRLIVAALLGAVVTFGLSASAEAQQSKKKKLRLTCSIISKECVRNCSMQANRDFCKSYCGVTHADCMQSGEWNGTYRTFTRVIKK